MTCKKEEECFSAPDLFENTSGRERRSFLLMYRYLSKSHWMRCVGSLERGDCFCSRFNLISRWLLNYWHQAVEQIEQLTRIKGQDQTSELGHQELKTSEQDVSQILSSSSVHFVCLLFIYLFTGFGKRAVMSNRKKGKTLCARYDNRRNQSQNAGSERRNKGETR